MHRSQRCTARTLLFSETWKLEMDAPSLAYFIVYTTSRVNGRSACQAAIGTSGNSNHVMPRQISQPSQQYLMPCVSPTLFIPIYIFLALSFLHHFYISNCDLVMSPTWSPKTRIRTPSTMRLGGGSTESSAQVVACITMLGEDCLITGATSRTQ